MPQTGSLLTLTLGLLGLIIASWVAFSRAFPTPIQYFALRSALALSGAFVATSLEGFLTIDLPLGIKAAGPLAIFVIMYFCAPAVLPASPTRRIDTAEVETEIVIKDGGQRDVHVPDHGVIAWVPSMERYRGRPTRIVKKELAFGIEPTFKLRIDNGKHDWHVSWFDPK